MFVSLFSESLFSLCWSTQKDQSKLHCCPSLKLAAKIACRDSYLGQDHKTFKDCIPPSLSCSVDCYLIRARPTCACLLFVCLFLLFIQDAIEMAKPGFVCLFYLPLIFVCLIIILPTANNHQSLAGFWDASSRLPDSLDRSKASNCHWLSHLLFRQRAHLLHSQHGEKGHLSSTYSSLQ